MIAQLCRAKQKLNLSLRRRFSDKKKLLHDPEEVHKMPVKARRVSAAVWIPSSSSKAKISKQPRKLKYFSWQTLRKARQTFKKFTYTPGLLNVLVVGYQSKEVSRV